MSRILILFAHPALEKSRVHQQLIHHIPKTDDITFHDLYEIYPDFDIDVQKEQRLLLAHDIIIWQHPFYWYSAPALIKQWMDLVLEHGWAYGSMGKMLAGKSIFNVLSAGASNEAYGPEGRNRFTIRTLLAPFEQTALLCQMNYLPPFVMDGTHRLSEEAIKQFALQYNQLLLALANDQIQINDLQNVTFLNELCPPQQKLHL
jgi:glutathione-regulated potassium-efflux system ancillary protein KefG